MNRRTKERRECTRALYDAISSAENAKLKASLAASELALSEAIKLIARIGAQVELPAFLRDEVDKVLPK